MAMKKRFGRQYKTVEEHVERYEQLLRERTDDLVIPINRFYRECRGEDGDEDGELVILELQKKGFEVRTVEVQRIFWNSAYILISR